MGDGGWGIGNRGYGVGDRKGNRGWGIGDERWEIGDMEQGDRDGGWWVGDRYGWKHWPLTSLHPSMRAVMRSPVPCNTTPSPPPTPPLYDL